MNISSTRTLSIFHRRAAQFALLVIVAFTVLAAGAVLATEPTNTRASTVFMAEEGTGEEEEEAQVQTDPADGAKLTRPARSLRVWFDRAPVVAKSSLSLEGPAGALQVQGLHTMGEDDLMARVVGAMPDGTYEASYSATFADGESTTGSWSFEIKRSGQSAR